MEDPSKYGVVVTDDTGKVDRFVEKPKVRDPNSLHRDPLAAKGGMFNSKQVACYVLSASILPSLCTHRRQFGMLWFALPALALARTETIHGTYAMGKVMHAPSSRFSSGQWLTLAVVAGQAHLRRDHQGLSPCSPCMPVL